MMNHGTRRLENWPILKILTYKHMLYQKYGLDRSRPLKIQGIEYIYSRTEFPCFVAQN
jgi:hypothetical protein